MTKYFYIIVIISLLSTCPTSAQIFEEDKIEDSVVLKRNQDFLLPNTIYKNINTRNSKATIIKDFNLILINHRGGVDYYQVNETAVGMRFNGQYLSEIIFRYFGNEGLDYESSLIKAGFLLRKKAKTSNIEIEPNFEAQLLDGEIRIYKKGSIVCKVYDGTYIGFTFYKTVTKK